MTKARALKVPTYNGQPIEFDRIAISEHQVQSRFMRLLADRVAERPELWGVFATPNGGHRDVITAVLLKAEGVKKGVPDVHLPIARGLYRGWWCEFKFGKNKPAPEQEEWFAFLRAHGDYVCVCWSADVALRDLLAYLDQPPALPAHSLACGTQYRGCAPDCAFARAQRDLDQAQQCAVLIGNGDHCPNVATRLLRMATGKVVRLCETCYSNVAAGAYGQANAALAGTSIGYQVRRTT